VSGFSRTSRGQDGRTAAAAAGASPALTDAHRTVSQLIARWDDALADCQQ
jgi:hypothetical protein